MAEALAVSEGDASKVELDPLMPHREHDAEELDRLYPSIEAVEDVDVEEPEDDPVLLKGYEIAKEIVAQASNFGRRRVQREALGVDNLLPPG